MRDQKIRRKRWERKYTISKLLGCSKISNKREIYNTAGLSQETREILSKQSNITS